MSAQSAHGATENFQMLIRVGHEVYAGGWGREGVGSTEPTVMCKFGRL